MIYRNASPFQNVRVVITNADKDSPYFMYKLMSMISENENSPIIPKLAQLYVEIAQNVASNTTRKFSSERP